MTAMPEPALPRDAATVMVLRDARGGGVEVCMVSRPAGLSFAARALVFPGGAVDPSDGSDEVLELAPGFDPAAGAARARLEGDGGLGLWAALNVAAVRELFEEAGLLLGGRPGGGEAPAAALADARGALLAGGGLAEVLRGAGLRIAPQRLRLVARFVTPVGAPRRYDTRFFACEAPASQLADPHLAEATSVSWERPAAVLEEHRDDWRRLMPPTRIMLRELAGHRSARAAIDDLDSRPVARVLFTARQLGELRLPDRLPLPGADESAT